MISIFIWNSIAVGFYGMILSAAFCDIEWTRKRFCFITAYMSFLMVLQGILYAWVGGEIVRAVYPLIMHVPLVLILGVISKKVLWSIIAVLTSYLCCQLRRWLSLFVLSVTSWNEQMQDMVELIITIPLLLFLLKHVAPSVREVSSFAITEQAQFAVIPLLGYCFDYITRVYTDWLNEGAPVVVEFMFFICSGIYLITVIRSSEEECKRSQMEQTQGYLNLQIAQSIREIDALRKSQEKTSIYRHDLRHHMMYISSCIENGRTNEAQEYIKEICAEVEANKIIIYSENETINLILSAFVNKAEGCGIPMEVNVAISQQVSISENDLCVLLSNALENALHACQAMKAKGEDATIEVSGFEKNSKIFFEIANSYDNKIQLKKGVPTTCKCGHGIGVLSICAITEKYNGIYSFSEKDGKFVLRVSL